MTHDSMAQHLASRWLEAKRGQGVTITLRPNPPGLWDFKQKDLDRLVKQVAREAQRAYPRATFVVDKPHPSTGDRVGMEIEVSVRGSEWDPEATEIHNRVYGMAQAAFESFVRRERPRDWWEWV